MNIWILNHYAVPQRYYYLARSYHFAKRLLEMGHSVTVFAASSVHNSDINLITGSEKYREMEEDGIRYVLFRARQYQGSGKARVINHIECAWKMARQCPTFTDKYGRPDLIYASAGQSLTLVAGIKLAKKLGISCVSEVTDLWPESFVAYGLISEKNPLLKMLYAGERWIYSHSDAVIFSMEGGRDYIIEKGWDKAHGGPVDLSKVYHINNGVDLAAFDYNKEHYVLDDADLDDAEAFKLVYTGSLRMVNDLSAVIRAAELLKKEEGIRLRVLIYGDGDRREELCAEAAKRGLDNVLFKGRVDKSFIPNILSRADACIMDGGAAAGIEKYGMSQNKLFDYLASGKPIISLRNSAYDIIKESGSGICVQNSPEKVADAIRRLRKDPELCERLGLKARETSLEFDFSRLTDKLFKIFEQLQGNCND